jgi:uncharacterized protein with PIN domain
MPRLFVNNRCFFGMLLIRGEEAPMTKTISRSELKNMKLKGKPRCPDCNNPLIFVYEGSKGFSGEKCQRCKNEFLVNTETLEVIRVTKAV